MPYKIVKSGSLYIVKSPSRQWKHDTLEKAKKQVKLLYMLGYDDKKKTKKSTKRRTKRSTKRSTKKRTKRRTRK